MAARKGRSAPKRSAAKKKKKKPATPKRRKSTARAKPAHARTQKARKSRTPAKTPKARQARQARPSGPAQAPSAPGASPGTSTAGSSGDPTGLRVRMFRVGFGDFFLVSVPTEAGAKHILIDCGVHAGDIGSIADAVDRMASDTDHNLALVIMTHRHADHISGFATCKDVFSQFSVEQVWMSWFEDPGDEKTAAFQASLAGVAQQLGQALAARKDPGDAELRYMAENIIGAPLAFGKGSSNQVALDVLHGGFKNKPPIDYYKAGDPPTLPQDLIDAGLTAQILGPPHDLALVAQMNGKNEQYLTENAPSVSAPIMPFPKVFRAGAAQYPKSAFHSYGESKIKQAVTGAQPDVLAAKARQADNTLNNQSLVVLFTFRGKHLLFVGDAQWGNWENFLYGGPIGNKANPELTDASKSILGSIDFYKVGHHGSTNATPKDALNAMREGCVAMCSTEPGYYGKASSGTEVPRGPLLGAIETKTDNQLARSDQVGAGTKESPDPDAGSLPKVFTTPGKLYIDYTF